jgi:hypothetical protein
MILRGNASWVRSSFARSANPLAIPPGILNPTTDRPTPFKIGGCVECALSRHTGISLFAQMFTDASSPRRPISSRSRIKYVHPTMLSSARHFAPRTSWLHSHPPALCTPYTHRGRINKSRIWSPSMPPARLGAPFVHKRNYLHSALSIK